MFILSQFLVAVFFYRQVLSIIIIFLASKRSYDKRQMASLLRKFYLLKRCRATTRQIHRKFLGFSELI